MTLAEYNLNDPPPKGVAHANTTHPPYLISADSIIPRSCIAPSASRASTSIAPTANSDFSFDRAPTNYNHSRHDLPSILRKSSITTRHSPDDNHAPTNWLHDFAASLDAVSSPHVRIIASTTQLSHLLDWYYTQRYTKRDSKVENNLFPYLHGLNNLNQRGFFSDGIIQATDSARSFLPLGAKNLTNLMFVNSGKPCGKKDLVNTIDLDDLLIPKPTLARTRPHFDLQLNGTAKHPAEPEFESFDFISSTACSSSSEINNRNYKDQIKLMAPLSSFVVYNYEGNDNTPLGLMLSSLQCAPNYVFVVSSSVDLSSMDSKYFEDPAAEEDALYNNEMVQIMTRLNESNDPHAPVSFPYQDSKLLNYEQSLIWRLNSMKKIRNDKICLGNIIDFNNMSGSNTADFKLIINCHENASFPCLSHLDTIFQDLKKPRSAESTQVYYLEFPSSGSFNPEKINTLEILSFLNTLKLVYTIVETLDLKVFLYSFDGFTGLSLLTICIQQTLESETMEDSIVALLSDDSKSSTRLYYFKPDLVFLKHFEKFINYMKHHDLADSTFQDSVNFLDVNEFHDKYMQKVSMVKYDWFNLNNDNNFPSRILPGLYLGSLNHANSITVLNTKKISHLISIGECPYWVKHLKDDFVFDCKEPHELNRARQKNIPILKPIYEFNNGESKIYEVEFKQFPDKSRSRHVPRNLETLVFIYNLKDDGKDSFLQLLTECPPEIQSRFLLGDSTPQATTLIHCRIGVSRSASIVLASMMKRFNMSLLACYLFLRVQRFNIIIQPNLRLFYELFLYEEYLGLRATMDKVYNWEVLCNEIYKLNNHYI